MDFETKTFLLELKEGEFCGHAARFDNLDSDGDIIQKGAFKRTLAERSGRIKLCLNHDLKQVLGPVYEISEDDQGLYFRAKFSDTQLGRDTRALVMDGALSEMSIGYKTRKSRPGQQNGKTVRFLEDLELLEFSVVSLAANDQARILAAKAEEVEEKAGRVLSRANREKLQRIRDDIDSLLLTGAPETSAEDEDETPDIALGVPQIMSATGQETETKGPLELAMTIYRHRLALAELEAAVA